MALAWVQYSPGKRQFEIGTGSNHFYDLYLTTRPELLRPQFSQERTSDNFFSTRDTGGKLLQSESGRALFPLPAELAKRFGDGRVYFMVKTFRDENGDGPAVSPVGRTTASPTEMSELEDDLEPTLELETDDEFDPDGGNSMDVEAQVRDRGTSEGSVFSSSANGSSSLSNQLSAPRTQAQPRRTAGPNRRRERKPAVALGLAVAARRVQRAVAADPRFGTPPVHAVELTLANALDCSPSREVPGASVAQVLNGAITGRAPYGDARTLARHVADARVQAQSLGRRRLERALDAGQPDIFSSLIPALANALPSILPMVTSLLGGGGGAAGGAAAAGGGAAAAGGGLGGILSSIGPILQAVGPLIPMLVAALSVDDGDGGPDPGTPAWATDPPAADAVAPPPPPPPLSAPPLVSATPPTPTAAAPTQGLDAGKVVQAIVNALQQQQRQQAAQPARPAPAVAPPAQAPRPTPTAPPGTTVAAQPAQAAPQLTPQQAATLLSALQAAHTQAAGTTPAGAGASALMGGMPDPGMSLVGDTMPLVQSVVDRIPITQLFDGTVARAWMPPANDYDHWIETMPWDKVLSLSDPVTTFGALFVPGRHDLDALQDVHLDVVNRTLTKLDGGNESWIFLADQPARLQLEIVAGAQGMARPFVDVRVSRDGSPSTAIQRSVFRVASFGANERRVVPVELPPEILKHCPSSGAETCVSLRVIEQSGETYAGAEVRACFHVVHADTVLMETAGALREAPELDDLAGLERQIPRPAIPSGLSAVDWSITITNRSKTQGLAKYLPVQQRGNGDSPLEGGIAISSIGLADLARRAHENDLTADELARFAQALDEEGPLRHRLSLNVRETVEPQLLARSERGLGVRTEFGSLRGYLVSFGGAGPDGNPSRRDVRSVVVPVPRGIALEEV